MVRWWEEKKHVLMHPLPKKKDLAPAASILLEFLPFKDLLCGQNSYLLMECSRFSCKVCHVVICMTQKYDYHQKHVLKRYWDNTASLDPVVQKFDMYVHRYWKKIREKNRPNLHKFLYWCAK